MSIETINIKSKFNNRLYYINPDVNEDLGVYLDDFINRDWGDGSIRTIYFSKREITISEQESKILATRNATEMEMAEAESKKENLFIENFNRKVKNRYYLCNYIASEDKQILYNKLHRSLPSKQDHNGKYGCDNGKPYDKNIRNTSIRKLGELKSFVTSAIGARGANGGRKKSRRHKSRRHKSRKIKSRKSRKSKKSHMGRYPHRKSRR